MSLRGDRHTGSHRGQRHARPAVPGCRHKTCTDRSSGEYTLLQNARREERGPAWRSWIGDGRHSRCPMPMEFPDRARKERYYDPDFYQMEVELLWSRVWQMACRLEEIPEPDDFVEYEILDQSVVVVRTEDLGVRAFQNACRHRGVRVVEGRGTCESGFICPFHGWCYGPDGKNTFVTQSKTFAEHNLEPDDLDLTPVRCERVGRLCVDQPRRRRSTAAGVHRAVRHRPRRLEGRVDAGRVVVRLPPAGELEARRRGVHGAVPRDRDPSPAGHPGTDSAPRRADPSIHGSSSTPSSTTCAR